MLTYQKLINKPKRLIRLTGLTKDQYEQLAQRIEPTWKYAERQRLSRLSRKRAIGAGRRYKLVTIYDKLLVPLMVYRVYATNELFELIFDLDDSNLSRLMVRMRPLITKAADPSLGLELKRAKRQGKKIKTLEEFITLYPDLVDLFTDATEQQRRRPKKAVQKRYYSGKKKRHTLKTQITVNAKGKILDVSATYTGKTHDKTVLEKDHTADKIPKWARWFLDLGYDGLAKDYPKLAILLPVKRRRNHTVLTRKEKRYNKKQRQLRVIAEHVLSRMKKYQVLAQVYRHHKKYYNQDFRNIAALVNFRLAFAKT